MHRHTFLRLIGACYRGAGTARNATEKPQGYCSIRGADFCDAFIIVGHDPLQLVLDRVLTGA